MITWENINNKEFENLAFEYMVSNYPNLRWEKTKMTNDGNKDGESVISYLPFNTTIKYWYEAKYSVNTNKSIPKSHLDSTLVSSLLDGHVVVIAFITNAFGLLNMAKDIFEKSNEPRRLLDSLSEIAFTKALLEKDYSIIMLQNIGDKMKEQKYIHSYTRNCLKIIVIMLLSQKYTQTELLNLMNKMLMKNTAIASGKRHQAIAYHVLAAIYYFYNDIIQANKYSEKCLQLFSELGEDYKKIQFHNAEIKRKGKIILACENPLFDSDNFILDTRIW